MAACPCAERRDAAIVEAFERSLKRIRESYVARDIPGVLAHTSSFY
nr:hypothetical protein [Agrobacterium tumefaciens]